MSRHQVRSLVCDKPACTAQYGKGLGTEGELRKAARQAGWKRTPGNRDYCPDCNPWPGLAAWALAQDGDVA
ncbi:hypothetical protein ABZV65_19840 [Streptomyces bauhiniae]|uniref:hypothetical protein n=1 Tax=Streptomyces bauhiniae TaxID=2340725 RepID=UPI0033A4B44A